MDREKVIFALKLHRSGKCQDTNEQLCPYWGHDDDCYKRMADDILSLLKEQETVEPKTGHWIYKKYDDMFMCSSCEKYSVRNDYPYCHWCGVKMKQEGR